MPNKKPYPTDVSDEEWAFVAPYLAPDGAKQLGFTWPGGPDDGRSRRGDR